MANFGLSKPYFAKYAWDSSTSAAIYTDGFKCNKAINTSVTPNSTSAKLYADNDTDEDVTEFTNASITLGVNSLPADAVKILFGHTIDNSTSEELSKTGDQGSYVGYGFVVATMDAGVKKYQGCVLHRCKFVEGEESYETKGESITFSTPSLSGTAYGDGANAWRTKSPLKTTEAEAENWVKTFLGI